MPGNLAAQEATGSPFWARSAFSLFKMVSGAAWALPSGRVETAGAVPTLWVQLQPGWFHAREVDMNADTATIAHTGLPFCRPAGWADAPPVIPHAFASDVDEAPVVSMVGHGARLIRTCAAGRARGDPDSNSCHHAGFAEGVPPVVVPVRRGAAGGADGVCVGSGQRCQELVSRIGHLKVCRRQQKTPPALWPKVPNIRGTIASLRRIQCARGHCRTGVHSPVGRGLRGCIPRSPIINPTDGAWQPWF